VYQNEKFVHILDTVSLDDNCYLKITLSEKNPKSVFELPEDI
jgi:hypothetical protein